MNGIVLPHPRASWFALPAGSLLVGLALLFAASHVTASIAAIISVCGMTLIVAAVGHAACILAASMLVELRDAPRKNANRQ